MKRYTVDFVTEKKQKLYYIQDDETLDLALLPTKYLKHKVDANRSPNTVRRIALSICYYMNYLTQIEIDLIEVTQLGFEEQSRHFGQFLYWIKEGNHITDNRIAKTGNGTCNAYLKDVFGFFLYMADCGYAKPLRVLSYDQITVANAVGVRRKVRYQSFKGYLKEKDRDVRAAEEPEIIEILKVCTNIRDQLLLLLIAETGFRIGEILGIDYTKDIDYGSHLIKVYLWDFTIHTSEQLKRQVYSILHYILENAETMCGETNRTRLAGLRYLYQYCIEENIHDIEQIELHQAEKFCNVPTERLNAQKMASALNYCRYALFMQADEINWDANVWYLDRFQLQPERINESNEVKSLSFIEVPSKENRDLIKKYARYSIGITNITIGVIQAELINIRK